MYRGPDYSYHVNKEHGQPVLVIVDLNQGGTSVTNSIETVVGQIADKLGEQVYLRPIVYRDSEGIYDGVDGRDIMNGLSVGLFYRIGATEESEAVQAAIRREGRQQR